MKIETIYVEDAIANHKRTINILNKFPTAKIIPCEKYSEVFNPKNQNFRIQKQNPSLILAKKHNKFTLTAPEGYGIGGDKNYYFSHMLNCLYDCRYCFLQGMYRSANYVIFVNYEDFIEQIINIDQQTSDQQNWFFSGYDCDSLAMDHITEFSDVILDAFEPLNNSWLEFRTKSTQIRRLLARKPLDNVVVAFSLNPTQIAEDTEHLAPSLAKRLKAMDKLATHGWKIGLRFDPIIYTSNVLEQYQMLFKQVFSTISPSMVHSVSLGVFRLPKNNYQTLLKLYPEEKIFHAPLSLQNGMIAYSPSIEEQLMKQCSDSLLEYISPQQFFPCSYDDN